MKFLVAVALIVGSALAIAGSEHVVLQKNIAFAPKALKVKAGDSIRFTNEDPVPHNVFSLSKENAFDLGVFEKGASKKVVLEKPGIVDVECSIHPAMKLRIEVEK